MSDGAVWTVRRILEWTTSFFTRKNVDSPRLSAERLLSHVLTFPRIRLYTEYDRPMSEAELASFRALVQRAADQEPIEYLSGTAHFFNLEFKVSRDVLIPRPDTETLVENVLQLVRNTPGLESPRVLDLCTGSGCIAAAIAKHLKNAFVLATDISEKAVAMAKENIAALDLTQRVTVEQGDLFDPISRIVDARPFDIIVGNPPYIASNQIPELDRSVKDYEPMLALDGGEDGLDIHRRILEKAHHHLVTGGRLYLEIAYDQGENALTLAQGFAEYSEPRILKDTAANDRVLMVQKI